MSRERVLASMEKLGADELEVLAEVADGLAAGRRIYGELSLDRDLRDFEREALEEARDGQIYTAIRLIQLRRAGGRVVQYRGEPPKLPLPQDARAKLLWFCPHTPVAQEEPPPCGCFLSGSER